MTDIVKAPYSVFYATFRYVYEDNYPAKLNEDMVRGLIRAYSDPGELVLDPFCGSGVVLKVAKEEGRRAIGIDLNPEAVKLSSRYSEVIQGDCLELLNYPPIRLKDSPDLVVTSPPYGLQTKSRDRNLHKAYTDDPRDLGNMNYPDFRLNLALFIDRLMLQLKPSRFAIIFLKDRMKHKIIQPLSVWLIEDATKQGWLLRGRGFIPAPPFTTAGYTPAKMKKRNYPSWIPAQEDVLLFQKPPLNPDKEVSP